jgi:hypothetical protein
MPGCSPAVTPALQLRRAVQARDVLPGLLPEIAAIVVTKLLSRDTVRVASGSYTAGLALCARSTHDLG